MSGKPPALASSAASRSPCLQSPCRDLVGRSRGSASVPRARSCFCSQFGPGYVQREVQTWETFSLPPGLGWCPRGRGPLRPVLPPPPQVLLLPLVLRSEEAHVPDPRDRAAVLLSSGESDAGGGRQRLLQVGSCGEGRAGRWPREPSARLVTPAPALPQPAADPQHPVQAGARADPGQPALDLPPRPVCRLAVEPQPERGRPDALHGAAAPGLGPVRGWGFPGGPMGCPGVRRAAA